MSRIKWERAKALIQHLYAFSERPTEWPERFAPMHLAHLQAPPIGKDQINTAAWQSAIESAAAAGELPSVLQSFALDPPFASHAGFASAISAGMEGRRYAPESIRPLVKTWPGISAGDFKTWLKSQGETASEHIAAWFDSCGTAPAQTPAPVVDTKPDVTLMATRQQLIDAFGSFTGMNASWFSNIKDTPALLAARKVTGQGGRHFAEPLFCPFEVLQWLIDPARRKGRPLGQAKGWELFEGHFPRAYAAFSVGDPRTD